MKHVLSPVPRCIYNALSDIKPEVENVIKMGRKLVDGAAENGLENAKEVTKKIDSLKEDFNETGAQVQQREPTTYCVSVKSFLV